MALFRSRLRLIAIAWLACQVTSLAAFVPEDCCPTHTAHTAHAASEPAEHHGEATSDCHETAEAAAPEPEPEPGTDCPMRHDNGEPCPMHRSAAGDCGGISNGCEGPNRPLARLFSFAGIIEAPVPSMIAPGSTPAAIAPAPPLLYRLSRPDAPPPKS